MNKKEEEVEIDLLQLAKALLKKSWAIVLTALIFGSCALLYTEIFVTPLYKARTLMYVNNNALNVGDVKMSISSGDLSAAQSLVDTYTIILGTRSTLDEVAEVAGLDYSYEKLSKMVTAGSVNSTEIFYVEVTSPFPKEAETIANTIGQILPDRKASPSNAKNTILGMLVGIVISCGVIVVMELMDDEIHSEDYLMENFEIPVLAVVPELTLASSGIDYYSYGYGKSSKGGKENG